MENERSRILVVDDDRKMASIVVAILTAAGHQVIAANTGADALALLQREELDLVITDLCIVGTSGHQLQEIKRLAPSLPVVIITAFASIPTAVELIKLGAFDYIIEPFSDDELMLIVSRALEDRCLRQELKELRGELTKSYSPENIIAASQQMTEVLEIVGRIADSGASVLLTGENGTGKKLIARALHFRSRRHQAPFVAVNCAMIPDDLLESELFCHVKRAFTDMSQAKTGLFQTAGRGTLFLDDIGEMPLILQAKFLRVLEYKRVRSVGATEESAVDVRIVSSTRSDLEAAIGMGKFRADLYYRLATVILALPPLRERPDDIRPLIQHFLGRACAKAGRPMPEIEPEAMACLTRYQWPGNIWELQNTIPQVVNLCCNNRIMRGDLPARVTGQESASIGVGKAVSPPLTFDQLEREYARAVLASVGGNKTEAATILGIDRKTLCRKLAESEFGR
jgi:DNA-binding NtrC family response regulator